jgi:NTE family protein
VSLSLFHRRKKAPSAREAQQRPPKRLGLVLGGGAVRGAAHLGVLSVFEREGIVVDVVTGTSVGAIVGAGVAAGIASADMLATFKQAKWSRIAIPAWRSKLSLFDTDPLGALIESVTHTERFEDLRLPFAAIATDLLTGTRVTTTSGPLRPAIVASSAIPALFEPVRDGGRMLVDGGLVDNLPVDAAIDLGADYVIAVDIMPPLDGSFTPADTRDVILLTWNIVQRAGEIGRDRANLVITPDVATVSLMDFSKVQSVYDAGVAAAEAALPDLLRDLKTGGPATSDV